MIRAQELTRTYRTRTVETTALDRVDLGVDEGEFVALMGPSGSGKSTLLNVLGLIDSPTSGRLEFRGEDVGSLPERELARRRKAQVGFVFQSFNLIDELTVAENVELPLRYLGRAANERRSRVIEVLERMEIDHRRDHRPAELSGGQQQRVAIARAVVADPALLLADEPTGNLDSKTGDEVMSLLSELHAAGSTLVMVTHSDHCAAFASRVLTMADGRIEAAGA